MGYRAAVVVELEFDSHAGQNRDEFVQQGAAPALPADPENQPREVMVILGVDSVGWKNRIVGLEELICRKAVFLWQLIEVLLGRGDDLVDNLDI